MLVSDGGYYYDCGLEFNPDGSYGRSSYSHRIVNEETVGIQGLYYLIWSNMASLCVCLLTQKNATGMFKGYILSCWQAVPHYCIGVMNAMWLYLQTSLQVTIEELVLINLRAMQRFVKVIDFFSFYISNQC